MNNVKNILDSLLQPSHQNESWKIHLIKNWPTIIGNLHEKISLQKIHANCVVLGVYDSSWMQELYLLSKLILKKINDHLDRPRIETLRFQCIESSAAQTLAHKNAHKNFIKNQPIKIDKKFSLQPDEVVALQKIQDPELSAALKNFLKKCQE